jgi:RNA polymerase sigma-70 factor (ECF subfamily)
MDDQLLIKRAQDGDIDAFEDLIRAYEKKIYSIAYNMMNSREDAQDVTQETVLKIFRSLSMFNGKSTFSAWIYKVTTNTCLDELRKRKHTLLSIEKMSEDGVQFRDDAYTSEELLTQKLLGQRISAEIDTLSPDYKLMIVLRDVQGMSYQQIAEITGISIGTVKSRINRARRQLREKLEDCRELLGS